MQNMHPLAALISQRQDGERWSLSDVAANAVQRGHHLTKNNLQRIKTDPIKSLKADIIFAIADGIGVTPLTVANAVIASMGIEPHPVEVTDTLATLEIDPTLTESDRGKIRGLVVACRTGVSPPRFPKKWGNAQDGLL